MEFGRVGLREWRVGSAGGLHTSDLRVGGSNPSGRTIKSALGGNVGGNVGGCRLVGEMVYSNTEMRVEDHSGRLAVEVCVPAGEHPQVLMERDEVRKLRDALTEWLGERDHASGECACSPPRWVANGIAGSMCAYAARNA
jgi:hypothetical protein